MAPLLSTIPVLSATAANLLLASIWQGLLLVVLVCGCLRLARGVTPAARFVLWTAVLVMVVLLPGLSSAVPHAHLHGIQGVPVSQVWSVPVFAIWVVLSSLRGFQLAGGALRLQGLLRRATKVEPYPEIAALLEAGARPARLCVSTEIERPSVAGFLRPWVILPPDLRERLSSAELQQVVLHEMEHLRRRDDWVNLLQQMSLVLMPLNPVLLWLDQRLCRERELACDDGVLQATRARKVYAACLLRLAEGSMVRKGVSLALAAVGKEAAESELAGRVRRILFERPTSAGGKRFKVVTWGLLAAVVATGGLLAGSPQLVHFGVVRTAWAQDARVSVGSAPVAELAGPTRPTLVKAVFEPGAPGIRRTSLGLGHEKRRGKRRVVRSASAMLPVVLQQPAWRSKAMQTRLTLASVEISQQVYAAVLFQTGQDGWLFVQL